MQPFRVLSRLSLAAPRVPCFRPYSVTSSLWESAEFKDAAVRVKKATSLDNQKLLQLYALFKQATAGVNNTAKPGMMDFVGKEKWKAWSALGDMSKVDAEKAYIALVDSIVGPPGSAPAPKAAETSPSSSCLIDVKDGVLQLTLNRPDRFNAFNFDMYSTVQKTLEDANGRDDVRAILITGAGKYYSSGNDLANFMTIPPEGPQKLAADAAKILEAFVNAFIEVQKPLIAAVNGPAIGIPVTLLGLFDFVYASNTATFHTPFTSLGQSPEACSSVTFPRIMGPSIANEMLLLGKKFSAVEARDARLVTRVIESSALLPEVQEIAAKLASLPPGSMKDSRALIRDVTKAELKKVNAVECELLRNRWVSVECFQALQKFASRK